MSTWKGKLMQLWCAESPKALPRSAVLAVAALGMLLTGTIRAAATGAPPQEQNTETKPAQEMKPAPEAVRAPEVTANQEINIIRPAPTKDEMESWRRTLLKVPTQKKGCFTAKYPDNEWTEVPCSEPPHKLYPPRRPGNVRIFQVGGSSQADFISVGNGPTLGSTGPISEAEGSFDSMSNVTSECMVQCPNQICPANPSCTGQISNAFSLQLNTDTFTGTSVCNSSTLKGNATTPCEGWEQFVYGQPGTCSGCIDGAFIQYWIINWGPPGTSCPSPAASAATCNANGGVVSGQWCAFQFASTDPVYCVINSPNSNTKMTAEPINLWDELKVTGDAAHGAITSDSITLWEGSTPYKATGGNYFPDLDTQWTQAEFNIFGDGGGSEAVFNNNASMEVRNGVISSGTNGPGCAVTSFTGESNNLTLNTTPPSAVKGNMPALLWTQVLPAPSGTATCADATSVGDTHITTFDGLYYDFQASGDFVMVEAPGFTIQTRQASGAPTWPNAAVNKSIAVQMGSTVIEVDVDPNRLLIDHKTATVASGKPVLLPTGVQVTLWDGAYIITDNQGNSVSATQNSNGALSWINVTVGLGRTPSAQARGLLGNPAGNAHQLFAANGTLLNEPVSFTDLYNTYGESWRVPAGRSLFTAVSTIKPGIPSKPFFAQDLAPAQAAKALATCKAAGITNQALLDSCTLDTAVLNNEKAAKVFMIVRQPIHIVRPIIEKLPAEQAR